MTQFQFYTTESFTTRLMHLGYKPLLLECSSCLCSFELSLALFQIRISVTEFYQLNLTNKLQVQEYFFLLLAQNQVIMGSSTLKEQLFL